MYGRLMLALATCIVLGMIGYSLWPVFGVLVQDYATRTAFDSATWKAEPGDWDNPVRQRMVNDLLRRHPLVGMSRDDVEELLGVPTHGQGSGTYVYWLGPERSFFSIDSELLEIRFEEGRVAKAFLRTD